MKYISLLFGIFTPETELENQSCIIIYISRILNEKGLSKKKPIKN